LDVAVHKQTDVTYTGINWIIATGTCCRFVLVTDGRAKQISDGAANQKRIDETQGCQSNDPSDTCLAAPTFEPLDRVHCSIVMNNVLTQQLQQQQQQLSVTIRAGLDFWQVVVNGILRRVRRHPSEYHMQDDRFPSS
jgi:hypothetical protein